MTNEKLPAVTPAKRGPNLVTRAMAGLEELSALVVALEPLCETMTKGYHQLTEPEKADRLGSYETALIREHAARLRQTTYGPTDPRATRALFALCLDAIPAAKSFDSATFLDALIFTVMSEPSVVVEKGSGGFGPIKRERGGFTPAVVASAVRKIWKTSTFVPSIAEFVEALDAERRELQSSVTLAEWFLRERERLDSPEARERIRWEREWEAKAPR